MGSLPSSPLWLQEKMNRWRREVSKRTIEIIIICLKKFAITIVLFSYTFFLSVFLLRDGATEVFTALANTPGVIDGVQRLLQQQVPERASPSQHILSTQMDGGGEGREAFLYFTAAWVWGYCSCAILLLGSLPQQNCSHIKRDLKQGHELNSVATQTLSFINVIIIMSLVETQLFVGLAAESCSRIWLPCLKQYLVPCESDPIMLCDFIMY